MDVLVKDERIVEIDIYIADDIKKAVKDVAEKCSDYDVYLVGGYLRDSYTMKGNFSKWNSNKRPKDVDIVLVPKPWHEPYEPIVPVEVATNYFIMYNTPASEISDMEERGVAKLIGMRNRKLSTQEVQLIVYSSPMTKQDVVEDMDMNVVQALWEPSETLCTVTDAFIKGHQYKMIECLHSYDKERMFVRYERMEKKCKGYDCVGKPEAPEKKVIKKLRIRHSSSVPDFGGM